LGTDLGLRFKSTRGRGGVVEKIFISNVRMTAIPTDAIGFNLYYGGQGPTEVAENATAETKTETINEGTPQFRDIYIENVTCRGARRAIALQGLPEMPIRGIHLRNVSITCEQGIAVTDAEDISLEDMEILNSTGPVASFSGSRKVHIDGLRYLAGAETVVKAQGTKNAGITIKNTDLRAAKTDFVLINGAVRGVFEAK